MSSVESIRKTPSRLRSSGLGAVSTDLSRQLRANLIRNVEATATRAEGDLALWEM